MIRTLSRWVRVSRKTHCPICGHHDWCGITSDGAVARCMRVESDRPSPSGEGGWIHQLDGHEPVVTPIVRHSPGSIGTIDWDSLLAQWRRNTLPGQYRLLATSLGVTKGSLEHLGAVYAAPYRAWAFPMRDHRRRVIGIRLRNDKGAKWAVRGSKQGLFWPDIRTGIDLLLIVEGVTDVAAMLDLGYDVIGRPSCSGGTRLIEKVIEHGRSRDVVILADRDEPKKRPDGSVWYPGQEGAERLANRISGLTRSIRVIKPLKGKDARAWLRSGATRCIVDMVIANACYWRAINGR